VSKKIGKPENQKSGNRGPGSGSGLGKQKNGVPRFQYPVFTGLPETGLNIYFLYFRYIFLVRALHICKENLLVSLHHT
jgi:hypothetical protein